MNCRAPADIASRATSPTSNSRAARSPAQPPRIAGAAARASPGTSRTSHGTSSFQDFVAAAPQAARDRAGAAIYDACFTAIFRHCTYNADPHPGNYLFAESGAVTLLDFGCVKHFAPDFIAGWKRISRAILDDDRAGFRAAWIDAGFIGRRRRFDFDHQFEAMRFMYGPALATGPVRFTHDFTSAVHDRLIFQNRNKLKLALPADWLFVNRLQFGLFSVLAHLGASATWGELLRAAVEAPTAAAA